MSLGVEESPVLIGSPGGSAAAALSRGSRAVARTARRTTAPAPLLAELEARPCPLHLRVEYLVFLAASYRVRAFRILKLKKRNLSLLCLNSPP